MATAAESAQEKLMAVLPPERRLTAETTRIYAPDFGKRRNERAAFDLIHTTLRQKQVLYLSYTDEQGQRSERDVHPLGLFFWGDVWLLVAWCEKRRDFRSFRLDRCRSVEMLARHFHERPEQSLAEFLRRQQAQL